MAIKIKNTKYIGDEGIKALVYGDAKIGKTTLMGTAECPIVLSAESGLLSLKDANVDYLEVVTLDDVYEYYKFLTESEEASKYETIGLDSITEIADVVLSTYKKNYKDPRKAYMDLGDDMMEIIRKFRDIKGKNVIFSAQSVRLTDEDTGITKYTASMPGKTLLNKLPFYFDEVFYLTIQQGDDGENYRVIKTSKGYGYDAGDRSGKLNTIEEPNLAKIFNKIKGVN